MINFLRNIDYSLFHFINHSIANPFFDLFFATLRNAYTWIPLYIILGVYCILKFKRTAWVYIACVVLAFALSDAVIHGLLKPFFGRLRPCHHDLLHARLVLGYCGGIWGFPSSHASNHMAMALTIVLTRFFASKWINTAWIGWALLIGFAQVYVGVHYPADIAGGVVFGIAVSLFIYRIVFPVLIKLHGLIFKKNS